MSWESLVPDWNTGMGRAAASAVEFSVGMVPGGKKRFVAAITVRPGRLEQVHFLAVRGLVSVQRGAGEHLGKMRVMPGGAVKIGAFGGPGATVLRIMAPLWPGLPASRRRAPVTFRLTAEALEIDLPAWAWSANWEKATPPVTEALVSPSQVKSAMLGKPNEGRGFSMLGGQVPRAGRP